MLGKGSTKSAAADDDEVKRPKIVAGRQTSRGARIRVNSNERLVERIADVTPKNVTCESSQLCLKRRHNSSDAGDGSTLRVDIADHSVAQPSALVDGGGVRRSTYCVPAQLRA